MPYIADDFDAIREALGWTSDEPRETSSGLLHRQPVLASRTVHFGFGSSELSDRTRERIAAMVRLAEKMGAASVRVDGFAYRGERSGCGFNAVMLAARRATVVCEVLVAAGCPARVRKMVTVPGLHLLDPADFPQGWPPFAEITLEESDPPPAF